MKKRYVSLLLSAVMVAATVLTGCGGSAGDSVKKEDKDGSVHLKWAMWDKSLIEYWEDLAEEYMAAHPDVEIECVDFGSNDYSNVLATELSGSGTEIDIVSIKDVVSYATLIEKNAIIPLDEYIEKDSVDLAKFNGVTDQVTADGKLYELPFRSDLWWIFYNKDIFDAKGIDYPSNDMTWEEYDELARKVSDTTKGSEVYGAHYHPWPSTVQLLGTLDGEHSVLDKEYDFMAPYYEMVLNQEDDGVCMKYPDLITEGLHYSAAFSNGNIAMMNMGSWAVTTLLTKLQSGEFDPELCGNWAIASYPHAEGVEAGTTLGAITGLAIAEQSDQKDAAWDFINWVSGEEGAKVLAKTGNFPAMSNDEIINEIVNMEGFPQDEQSKEAMKVTKMYLETPYDEQLSQINEVLGTYHAMIMNRECTVEEGIASMNEEAAKIQ